MLILLRKIVIGPGLVVARYPVHVLLFIRLLEELWRRWVYRQGCLRDFRRIKPAATSRIDTELLQGCIFSAENLMTLGRVEKRTLFSRSILELLGGNTYLAEELLRGARACSKKNSNCLVARYMQADARYHVLQACLNTMSTLIGPSYIHFSALHGEDHGLYKSSWYCLTVMMPTRPETVHKSSNSSSTPSNRRGVSWEQSALTENSTFTDLSRTPRAALRVVLVNEAEIRQIAQGKLKPPAWGFYNSRQAERWRMLVDFAKNFQSQLVRTTADSRSAISKRDVRSPFTNEHVHDGRSPANHSRHARDRHSRSSSSTASLEFKKMRRIESSPYMPMGDNNSQQSSGRLGEWRGSSGLGDNSQRAVASSSLAELSARNPMTLSLQKRGLADGSSNQGSDPQDDASPMASPPASSNNSPRGGVAAAENPERRTSRRREGAATEPNCFLRLHVPHYVGRKGMNRRPSVEKINSGSLDRPRLDADKMLTPAQEESPLFVLTCASGSGDEKEHPVIADQDFGWNCSYGVPASAPRPPCSPTGPGPKWM